VPGHLAALNILAAEDNPLNQKLLQAIFDRTEANITVVNNGLEALEKLKSEPYDIVIMDVQMPVMDGYTAIHEIRNTLGMDIPIITLTAHAMVGEKEEGARIGANSYLSKPFKEGDLFREVLRLTRKIGQPLASETRDLATTAPEQSLVDEKYLREITADDQVLREELIELFAASRVQLSEKIFDALEKKDYETLSRAIHELRSSLMSVALLSSASKFREIEKSLNSNALPKDLAGILRKMNGELNAGLRELQATVHA
jgi:CheY-like chemotaxis protein